jgi:predicted RNA-binding Zn-ribbon protein involved in translation (DUF1610 family)
MFLPESKRESFLCELCGQLIVKPLTMGIQSDQKFSSLIQLCPDCGAVDLDLMQLCRELTISCSFN